MCQQEFCSVLPSAQSNQNQLKYNTMDVEELTYPIPQCPMPSGGCVHS